MAEFLSKILYSLKRAGLPLAGVVFPPRCRRCGESIERYADALCGSCCAAVEVIRQRPSCPTCARTVAPFEVRDGRCRHCRRRRLQVLAAVRVGEYTGELAELIGSYKYHGDVSLEPLLSSWLVEAILAAPWHDRIEAVVSVPTCRRHRMDRPFHAAEAIASAAANATRLPHARILRRVGTGPHQVGLDAEARAENVKGAFSLRRDVTLRGPRLLLIDDVKTTGATVRECAKVLHRAGAAEVYVAVLVTVRFNPEKGTRLRSI